MLLFSLQAMDAHLGQAFTAEAAWVFLSSREAVGWGGEGLLEPHLCAAPPSDSYKVPPLFNT